MPILPMLNQKIWKGLYAGNAQPHRMVTARNIPALTVVSDFITKNYIVKPYKQNPTPFFYFSIIGKPSILLKHTKRKYAL
jgi:hypothetical protein